MPKPKILVIEDERALVEVLSYNLVPKDSRYWWRTMARRACGRLS